MSDFKAKMHQIRPRWGSGELTALPRLPNWILGGLLLSDGRGGEEMEGEGTPCSPVIPPATTF